MLVDADGWLSVAACRPSPNYNARPPGCVVDLLVLHAIALPPESFGGPWIDDLFLNRLDTTAHPYFADLADLRVSAHLLLRRDGALIQYVSMDQRAWHAGRSEFQGREGCNDFSIGIELEGSDHQVFDPRQYQRLVPVIHAIQVRYPAIRRERILGHSDIAPGRKTDPGPCFDWSVLDQLRF